MPMELNFKKVLVLDGDADTIDQLDYALRDNGYQPVFVRRGTNVKRRVEEEKPGVIVMDVVLPDRDGRQVIKELKDDWDAKKIPIVILSNYTNRLDRYSRDKVVAVLGKPAEVNELMDELARALNTAKASHY
jgi:DNA-binding response OmpR family regulator